MTIPTLPIDVETLGIVGPRPLRALQLIRIGRHASTAMLVPHDGIWVVSGRGPETGSNGAGKTVLLGAISLHNGDPQWAGENGIGPNAARLLFDHNRARVGDVRYADAPHGYIIGAYFSANQMADAITVWMRIERHSSTYVQVRWSSGVRLVNGANEETRIANADGGWGDLRENETLTVTTYAEKLFGKTPRCIAYIRARGSEENQDRGLLALGQRPFRPRDLASQVITLAGKHQAVENERKFRQELDANEALLASKKADYQVQYRREEQEKRDIASRDSSRNLLKDASQAWQLYLNLGTLLAHDKATELRQEVARLDEKVEAKRLEIAKAQTELSRLPSRDELLSRFTDTRRVLGEAEAETERLVKESGSNATDQTNCKKRLVELREQAARALGLSLHDAEQKRVEAREGQRRSERDVERIKDLIAQKESHRDQLVAGRGGPAGLALAALDAEGVRAVPIVDLLTFSDEMRSHWEARLSPYANAVIVPRSQYERSREVLAHHPGTPLLTVDDEALPDSAFKKDDPGFLGQFIEELERRTTILGPDWVVDTSLAVEIAGGYTIPLTDRQAAIRAAENELANIRIQLKDAEKVLAGAEERLSEASKDVAAAEASVEIEAREKELAALRIREAQLAKLIADAKEEEGTAREQHKTAETNFKNADEVGRRIRKEIEELKTGESGLGRLLDTISDARERSRNQKAVVDLWQRVAVMTDLDRMRQAMAEQGVVLDLRTRNASYQESRSVLRQAVEAVLGRLHDETPVGDPEHTESVTPSADEYIAGLNTSLGQLHKWCDNPRAEADDVQPFDDVSRPLRAWLDWHGAEDETRKDEIETNREINRREIGAAEAQAADTRRWISSLRENQIAIITKSFNDIEAKLNELLTAVHQDAISLRPRYSDLGDSSQPLRWELHPQWLPPGAKPVDYSNPPNTAELIILHTLLATASLVATANPQGRMLILDESGNNLDGPNLTRVSTVLQQVARKYGLTIVLACQDLYTDRVARHSAAMIQLLRPSQRDPLNAPPDVSHGDEDPVVLDALLPYLSLGRTRTTDNGVEGS